MSNLRGTDQFRGCPNASESYGSILESELSEVWTRLEDWCSGERLPKECLDCELFPSCGGGCRHSAEMAGNGKCQAKDPLMQVDRIEEAKKLAMSKSLPSDVDLGQGEIAFKTFRLRKEAFGGVIWNGMGHQLVDETGYRTMESIIPEQTYSGLELITPNNKAFFAALIRRGFATFHPIETQRGGDANA